MCEWRVREKGLWIAWIINKEGEEDTELKVEESLQ